MQTAAAELAPLRPDSIVGTYGVGREKNKPICSIELTQRPLKKAGLFTAVLSAVASTRAEDLRSHRLAHRQGPALPRRPKGHEQSFAAGTDSIFSKEPPSGSQLFLKKQ